MINVDEVLRAAVRELADEGRPVYLGGEALEGVRRRQRRSRAIAVLALAAVTSGVLAWPQWTVRDGEGPPLTSPTSQATSPAWPTFSGLSTIPVPAVTQTAGGRLVAAAYLTHPAPAGSAVVLDPATGAYRMADVDSVLAFSPDLRYAVVTRKREVRDSGGSLDEYGIYNTVAGRVLGRLEVQAWVPPLGDRFVWDASWSPDGRSIVLGIRLAVQGRGWLTDKLIFVDVQTGAVNAVDVRPAGGLEPLDLLGWTTDSLRIALAADRTGTDEAPRGHIVYDRAGEPISVHHWPGQSNVVRVIGADDLLLTSMTSGEIIVMDLASGAIRHRYPTGQIGTIQGWQAPLGWRDGLLIQRSQICSSDGCADGREILGVAPGSGHTTTLFTLPESVGRIVVAPGGALTGKAAQLTW